MTAGRVALVTGGARGVGRAVALRLAEDFDVVVVNYFRSPQAARETVADLEAAGCVAHAIRASVAREEQVAAMFDEVRERFGRLDVLVNSAADGALAPVREVRAEQLRRAFDTNVTGAINCTLRAADLMDDGAGAIVNVSTLGGGELVMANYLACAPAKAGLEVTTRYLAVELAPRGIRVNTAVAGMLESTVADQFPDAGSMQRTIREATPFGRLGKAEELAEVVAFLASPRASWITGQSIVADGGLSTGAALLGTTANVGRIAAGTTVSTATAAEEQPSADAALAETPAETPTEATAGAPAPFTEGHPDDIVIVGTGLAVPGASSPEELAELLERGPDMMIPIPADRWDNERFWTPDGSDEDKTYSARSGFITDLRPHPAVAAELGVEPGSGVGAGPVGTEYTTLWLRHSLRQALDGVTLRDEDRLSFVVGYTADGSQHLEEATIRAAVRTRIGAAIEKLGVDDDRARRLDAAVDQVVAERYPRGGIDPLWLQPHQVAHRAMHGVLPQDTETLVVDTACSSSLYSLDIGMMGLLEGRHDVAVCGGAFAVGPRGSVLFAKLNGLSRSGHVRSLDAGADGVLFSDGAGVVVLKTRARAEADGDSVLATVSSVGTSSDGKGKAIYAPSPAGQVRAVERAFSGDLDAVRPDWIVAHATGTPAGDQAELTTLSEFFGPGSPIQVTSNKSVIGHTGWAAGAASVIHAVQSMHRGTIPAQAQFSSRREAPAGDALEVPTEPVPWPASDGPRTVAISGFGFGGTNANLILTDPSATSNIRATRPPSPRSRIAVVAAATHVPGQDDEAPVADPLATTFGDTYPLPPFSSVRMPPGALRAIDRCQLMVLQAGRKTLDQIAPVWEELRDDIGVFIGHAGSTRNAMLYATRCYRDDLAEAADAVDAGLRSDAAAALSSVVDEVRGLCPPSSEDTFPGMMPNVIAARVANYYDLHGPNMTIDTGLAAGAGAIDVASRYLRSGRLEIALVGGINGNTTPELAAMVPGMVGDGVLAEGCFMIALTTEERAAAAGLSVLGFVDDDAEGDAAGDDAGTDLVHCGTERSGRAESYLAGEVLHAVIDVLRRPAPERAATIVCHTEPGLPAQRLRLSPPPGEGPDGTETPAQDAIDWDAQDAVRRWAVRLRPATVPVSEGSELVADPATTVILTDDPSLLTDAGLPAGALVLTVPETVDETTIDEALAGRTVRHVRVVTRLSGDSDATPRTLALHDASFLIAKHLARRAAGEESSFVVVALQGASGSTPHPAVGLFNGLLKVLRLESVASPALVVAVESADPADGIAAATEELGAPHPTPLVVRTAEGRFSPVVEPEPLPARPVAGLRPDALVVAVGGGRGITAELLVALARHQRPRIVVLGSNRPDAHPADLLAMSDDEFAGAKAAYIARRRAEDAGLRPAALSAEFEGVRRARMVLANLRRLREHSGVDRVHYLACDVADADGVRAAMETIHRDHGHIDLLVHAAGLNRSAPVETKSLREFRQVRDLKVAGHANLTAALSDSPPRLWVNFGSLLGLTGQAGEADYASANDFLGFAAVVHDAPDAAQTTLGWTLWGEIGLGANELTKAYFDKSGLYSSMGTAEGIRHFLREIAEPRPHTYTVHLGDAEEQAVQRLLPGFLEQTAAPAPSSSTNEPSPGAGAGTDLPFYADRVVERDDRRIVVERAFGPERDAYLAGHVVGGRPTLPGAFVSEIAVEAARLLRPGLVPVALADLTFERFLKLGSRDVLKRVTAELVDGERPDGADVRVTVSEDILAPDGRVLVADRVHFTATVELRAEGRPPATWEPWDESGAVAVPDPYHAPGSPVLLAHEFHATTGTRVLAEGGRSRYTSPVPADHPVYSRFSVPVLLLDGLLRTGVLELHEGHLVPVCAPLRIGRLELFGDVSDAGLADRAVELYAGRTGSPSQDGPQGTRFVAVDGDNRVLLQVLDLDWVLLGHLDTTTGEVTERATVTTGGER
ncbi:SDR family oxidoreductase [Antribacter gilvus]|uniref:SDR family oxidoreductase n=1 Tax=Antribacter gilvus TaxID=2304675 RepID=UPI000F77AEC9|nr:SDR family oxidoreductase [Antribacter gilvus]